MDGRPTTSFVTPGQLSEFYSRHETADAPKLIDALTGRVLFADGAMIRRDGQMYEPPTETLALLHAKRDYVARKLTIFEEDWHAFRNDCSERLALKERYANCPIPGPPADAVAQLEAGAENIAQIRKTLAAMDEQIATRDPAVVAQRRILEQQRQEAQANRKQWSSIMGVEL